MNKLDINCLKRFVKKSKKISFTLGLMVAFLITGGVSYSVENELNNNKILGNNNNNHDYGKNIKVLGNENDLYGNNLVALGDKNDLSGDDYVTLGNENNLYGDMLFVLGYKNYLNGNNSKIFGTNNSLMANNSKIFGDNNTMRNYITVKKEIKDSFIIGNNSVVYGTDAIVLGSNATACHDGIAIGNNSVSVNNVVSFGHSKGDRVPKAVYDLHDEVDKFDDDLNRRLVHVDKGNISENSTDAINGSQFYELARANHYAIDVGAWKEKLGVMNENIITDLNIGKGTIDTSYTNKYTVTGETVKNYVDDKFVTNQYLADKYYAKNIIDEKINSKVNTTVFKETLEDELKHYAKNDGSNLNKKSFVSYLNIPLSDVKQWSDGLANAYDVKNYINTVSKDYIRKYDRHDLSTDSSLEIIGDGDGRQALVSKKDIKIGIKNGGVSYEKLDNNLKNWLDIQGTGSLSSNGDKKTVTGETVKKYLRDNYLNKYQLSSNYFDKEYISKNYATYDTTNHLKKELEINRNMIKTAKEDTKNSYAKKDGSNIDVDVWKEKLDIFDSTAIKGEYNTVEIKHNDKVNSIILAGWGNSIYGGAGAAGYSSIIGGTNNSIGFKWDGAVPALAEKSSIIGGDNNKIKGGSNTFIAAGQNNSISSQSHGAVILGGRTNNIERVSYSSGILGGQDNSISYSNYSSIIGGNNNKISGEKKKSENSFIIGNNSEAKDVSNVIILGHNSKADDVNNSIVLGDNSIGVNNAISVGGGTVNEKIHYNKIVNLADGEVTKDSHDVINGSQLYRLAKAEDDNIDIGAWKQKLGVGDTDLSNLNIGKGTIDSKNTNKYTVTGETVKNYVDSKNFVSSNELTDKFVSDKVIKNNLIGNEIVVTNGTGAILGDKEVKLSLKDGGITLGKLDTTIQNKLAKTDDIGDGTIGGSKDSLTVTGSTVKNYVDNKNFTTNNYITDNYYNKTTVDNKLNSKADKSELNNYAKVDGSNISKDKWIANLKGNIATASKDSDGFATAKNVQDYVNSQNFISAANKHDLKVDSSLTISGNGTGAILGTENITIGIKDGGITLGKLDTTIQNKLAKTDDIGDGTIGGSKDSLTVTGSTVKNYVDNKTNNIKTDLDKKVNLDGSNIDKTSQNKLSEKLSKGTNIERGDNTLTSGEQVKEYVSKEVEKVNMKAANIDGEVEEGDNRGVSGDKVAKVIAKTNHTMDTVTRQVITNAHNNEYIYRQTQANKQAIKAVNERIDKLDTKVDKVSALSQATANLDFGEVRVGNMAVGAGVSTYMGNQAVAVGVAYRPNQDWFMSAKWAGVAGDPHYNTMGGSISYQFNFE